MDRKMPAMLRTDLDTLHHSQHGLRGTTPSAASNRAAAFESHPGPWTIPIYIRIGLFTH